VLLNLSLLSLQGPVELVGLSESGPEGLSFRLDGFLKRGDVVGAMSVREDAVNAQGLLVKLAKGLELLAME